MIYQGACPSIKIELDGCTWQVNPVFKCWYYPIDFIFKELWKNPAHKDFFINSFLFDDVILIPKFFRI